MQKINKTTAVIDLLRHLPYIREASSGSRHSQGAAYCHFADWSAEAHMLIDPGDDTVEVCLMCSEGYDIYKNVPAHVVGITAGNRDNPKFLLDTELGVVYWHECPGEVWICPTRERISDDPYDYAEEIEAEWRAESGTWAIADFFETLKDQLRNLNSIPISPWSVVDVFTDGYPDGMIEELKKIYQQHGWPDLEKYDKKKCLSALRTTIEEKYPRKSDYY